MPKLSTPVLSAIDEARMPSTAGAPRGNKNRLLHGAYTAVGTCVRDLERLSKSMARIAARAKALDNATADLLRSRPKSTAKPVSRKQSNNGDLP